MGMAQAGGNGRGRSLWLGEGDGDGDDDGETSGDGDTLGPATLPPAPPHAVSVNATISGRAWMRDTTLHAKWPAADAS
jgi:hypothetical protein